MRSTWIAAAVFVHAASSFVPAAPERFAPEDHFPKECFFFASLDIGKLRSGLQETPFGRMLAHGGVEKALGGLKDRALAGMMEGSEEFTQLMGVTPLEFAALFEGEVAWTVPGVDMRHGPTTLISIELGSKRKEIEGAMERFGNAMLGRAGDAQTTEVKGHKVTTWPEQFGPSLQYTILGSSLVFGVGGALEAVIGRFEGEGGGSDALRFNPVYARAKLQASVASPVGTCFLNWEAIRGIVNTMTAGTPDGEEVKRAFEAIGLDKLSSVMYRGGIRDGDLEGKIYLDSPGGLSGILGLLASSFGPVEDPAALSRIPSGAFEIGAYSISTGRLIRGLHEKLKAGWVDTAAHFDGFVSRIEELTGLSFESDLCLLPKLSLYTFSSLPPAGGLIPDAVSIVRTTEIQPYLVALDKFAKKTGARVESLKIDGRDVAYFTIARIEERLGLSFPWRPTPAPSSGQGTDPDEERIQRATLARLLEGESPGSSLTIALAPIDADWMVLSRTPQGIARYFSTYSKKPSVLEEEAVAGLIKKEIGNDAGFALLRGGRHIVSLYNTALSIAMLQAPLLEKKLRAAGVSLAGLPPGEDFAGGFHDGFLLFRPVKDGFLVHGNGVVSNLLGSPTVFSALLELGLAMELQKKLGDEGPSAPEARLQALGAAFKKYAETAGMGAFPHDPAGSLAALQKVVDAGLVEEPSMLVHPGGGEKPARAAGGERVILAAENVSYELVPWKQGLTDNPARILAHEKKQYGGGGRHVLFVDLTVKLLQEADFQQVLREQSERYGKSGKKEEK